VWQALHAEFQAHGVDVITVALDTPTAAEPWLAPLDRAGPLALIDEALLTVEAFGWVNVPSTVWFDETGRIVRGPEISFVKARQPMATTDAMPAEQREMFDFINAFPHSGAAWLDALRDWVAHGRASRFARSADEVLAHSRAYGIDTARAAAHYALAEVLRHRGRVDDAVAHQREAHRLDPEQWNRKRQAWAVSGNDRFATSFLEEMRAFGPASFYPPVDLGG
jgi:hypothetical protein